MRRRSMLRLSLGTRVVLLGAACSSGPPAPPTTAPAPPTTAPAAAKPTTAAAAPTTPASSAATQTPMSMADEQTWEQQTYQAAKQEGKVTVYGFWNPDAERVTRDFLAPRTSASAPAWRAAASWTC